LVGERVGSRCAANVAATVAANKAAAERKAEELLRVWEPVSEGGAEHSSFFGSDVCYPIAMGYVGVLGGVSTVG
jgi:hypothetical protein